MGLIQYHMGVYSCDPMEHQQKGQGEESKYDIAHLYVDLFRDGAE